MSSKSTATKKPAPLPKVRTGSLLAGVATPPDIPGIDECDAVFVISSISGGSAVHIRVESAAESGVYYAQVSVELDEGSELLKNISDVRGPYVSPEEACRENVETAREWFRSNHLRYVYDYKTRHIVQRAYGRRPA